MGKTRGQKRAGAIMKIVSTMEGLLMAASEYAEVMTTEQAAAFLQINRKTLISLVQTGHIPATRVGDTDKSPYRFVKSQILDALKRLGETQQAARDAAREADLEK